MPCWLMCTLEDATCWRSRKMFMRRPPERGRPWPVWRGSRQDGRRVRASLTNASRHRHVAGRCSCAPQLPQAPLRGRAAAERCTGADRPQAPQRDPWKWAASSGKVCAAATTTLHEQPHQGRRRKITGPSSLERGGRRVRQQLRAALYLGAAHTASQDAAWLHRRADLHAEGRALPRPPPLTRSVLAHDAQAHGHHRGRLHTRTAVSACGEAACRAGDAPGAARQPRRSARCRRPWWRPARTGYSGW